VVTARLEDARFFYDEDRKVALAERARSLRQLTFHEKLGSYAAKADRLATLSEEICKELGWEDEIEGAVEAAGLLKADLAAEMVKEFTSLQGIVGGIYAREEGYPVEIWQALYDQYLPVAASDPAPRGRIGRVTALADRVDTLVGIFGIGLVPSGAKDPFGLRRAAQGALRILLEGEMAVDLTLLAARAARMYGDRLTRAGEEILQDLRPFLHDRLRHLLGREGFAYDEVEAALAVGGSNLPDLKARVEAVHAVREEPHFLDMVLAAKRIANILRDAPDHTLDPEALEDPAEKELHVAFLELRDDVDDAVAKREYEGALRRIVDLAEILERFFVEVLVMAEDPQLRANRIALLQAIQRTLSRTAHLTEVVVDKAEYRSRAAAEVDSEGLSDG
jgi:glycyl-tRNA synthetase beta chain